MKKFSAFVMLICLLCLVAGCDYSADANKTKTGLAPPVKVGLLHSHTGVMAASEMPVRDAEKLAIEEINAKGGILGRQIEIVEADGASNDAGFTAAAEKLAKDGDTVAVFGCWTSSSRKAVASVVESNGILLWYPVQYEGYERSKNVICLGLVPNQQVLPAIDYLVHIGRTRMFLIGNDYIFPRTANAIVKKQLDAVGGVCVGEEYVSLNHGGFADTVERIKAANPDVIINTLNGSPVNAAFFAAYRHAGLSADQMPVMSFSIGEPEISAIGETNSAGHFVCQGYFQSIAGERNAAFLAAYRKAYGARRTVGDATVTGYNAVYMWKAAVERAESFESDNVKKALKETEIATPEGIIVMDEENLHAYRRARIGRIDQNGQIRQIIVSDVIKPDPFLLRVPWFKLN